MTAPARGASLLARVLPWLLTAALLAGVASARAYFEARAELHAGRAAQQRGDVSDAIRHLRRAAHWYLPGSGPCSAAYEELETLAVRAEAQGRNDHALAAWRAVRASILGTRWLLTPEAPRLDRANQHIASLLADLPPPPEDRGKDRARLREEHLALLRAHRSADPAWVLLALVGFAVFAGSLWSAARHGFGAQERPHALRLALAGASWLLGLGLFLLGVSRA